MPGANKDEIQGAPPGPMQVAQRALIQCAVVCRGSLELGASDPDVRETFERLRAWLEDIGIAVDMEPIEARLLNAPLGSLSRQQVIDATWAAEGLTILAWALRRFDLPRHDAKADPFALATSLRFLEEDARIVVDAANLRSIEELRACREVFYAIHCRYGQSRRAKRRIDFTEWLDSEWLPLLGIDQATLLSRGDLAVGDGPIDDAEEDLVRAGEWIARRRHQASIWLVGEYPIYTQTPADI
jgi:hypothetical protein